MGLSYNPTTSNQSLIFCFDAKNTKCYNVGSDTCVDIAYGPLSDAGGRAMDPPTYNSNGFLTFNGSTNYIQFNAVNGIVPPDQVTIEAWVKTNSTNQSCYWFSNILFGLGQSTTNLVCEIRATYPMGPGIGGTLQPIVVDTATYMNTSTWYHVVFSFANRNQNLYINNTLVATGNTSINSLYTGIFNQYCQIGASLGPSNFYNGSLGLVKIYYRALAASEVDKNYKASRGRFNL